MCKCLAEIRRQKGKTQLEMAEMLGIGVSTYNMYEKGSRKIPKNIAEKVATLLDTEINSIFIPATFTLSKTKE